MVNPDNDDPVAILRDAKPPCIDDLFTDTVSGLLAQSLEMQIAPVMSLLHEAWYVLEHEEIQPKARGECLYHTGIVNEKLAPGVASLLVHVLKPRTPDRAGPRLCRQGLYHR